MEIVVHPARAQPLKTAALLAYVGLASWGLGAAFFPASTVPAGLGVLGVMLVLLRGWFLPTRYVLDGDGIEVARVRRVRRPWERFHSWRRERAGFYLSPFSDPRRFDNFRGVFLFMNDFVVYFSESGAPSGPAELSKEARAAMEALLEEKIGGRSRA